jgi:hypothetical protein
MEKVVVGSLSGPDPELELKFELPGNTNYFAKYSILKFDSTGHNPVLVGTGLNTDLKPDKFSLPAPVSALNGSVISWEVIVASFDSGSVGRDYLVRAVFTQAGKVMQGGDIPHSKKLDDHFVEFARMVFV